MLLGSSSFSLISPKNNIALQCKMSRTKEDTLLPRLPPNNAHLGKGENNPVVGYGPLEIG